ncbi:hypothetical protein [Streptomyces sp. SGAir0957]
MPRIRRAVGTALLVVAALAVGGCASDTEASAPRASAVPEDVTETETTVPDYESVDESDSDSESTDAVAGDDTSMEDALTAAGIGDALVNRLGEVGDANNYGLGEGVETGMEDRRRLAVVQVDTMVPLVVV